MQAAIAPGISRHDLDNLRNSLSLLSKEQIEKMSKSTGIKNDTLIDYRDGKKHPDDLVRLRALVHWARTEASRNSNES